MLIYDLYSCYFDSDVQPQRSLAGCLRMQGPGGWIDSGEIEALVVFSVGLPLSKGHPAGYLQIYPLFRLQQRKATFEFIDTDHRKILDRPASVLLQGIIAPVPSTSKTETNMTSLTRSQP